MGANIDEFATALFADPTIPLSAAWAHLWAGETNPPFFYLFARLWLPLTGPTLFERRLINLVPLAFLLAWFVYATARHPQHRPFLAGLALFAFTGKFFLWQFPDYRGYFSQYCAEVVFLGAACIAYLEHDHRPDLFQLVALPFLILLHQVTCIYTFVLLVPLVGTDLHRRFYFRGGLSDGCGFFGFYSARSFQLAAIPPDTRRPQPRCLDHATRPDKCILEDPELSCAGDR